jgi:hypothetical protein
MKRLGVTLTVAATIALTASGSALADQGAPGTTFPEQPGSHAQTACQTIAANPGTGTGGAAATHESGTAGAIMTGLYTDACVE